MKKEGTKIQPGRTLKSLRVLAGLNQKDLGNLIGISQQEISKLEHGVFLPGSELRQKISDALGQPASIIYPEL